MKCDYERKSSMRLTENHHRSGTPLTNKEVLAEFCDYLSRRISSAVEVIYEEVPNEAWPRISSRLWAAGLRPPFPGE